MQVPTTAVTEMDCKHVWAAPESWWGIKKIIPISQKFFHLSFAYERKTMENRLS